MCRTITLWAITLAALTLFTAAGQADVVIRGPFGGLIVVGSPTEVQVAPGGVVVVPAPVVPGPVVVAPAPMPAPKFVPAISPQEFVRTFRAQPGAYQVVFLHSRTNQPVTVAFELPPGQPRISYFAHSLLFDYGRHEVEIRFQIGGKVKVTQK